MEHEIQTGLIIQRAGFVTTDDGMFGASADGLIGEDGGSEYKCFLAPEKLRAFHIDNDASGIMDQVQGCMWITGRKFWHVGMYCPALEPVGRQLWWREFKRDDDYIEELESDLWSFAACRRVRGKVTGEGSMRTVLKATCGKHSRQSPSRRSPTSSPKTSTSSRTTRMAYLS